MGLLRDNRLVGTSPHPPTLLTSPHPCPSLSLFLSLSNLSPTCVWLTVVVVVAAAAAVFASAVATTPAAAVAAPSSSPIKRHVAGCARALHPRPDRAVGSLRQSQHRATTRDGRPQARRGRGHGRQRRVSARHRQCRCERSDAADHRASLRHIQCDPPPRRRDPKGIPGTASYQSYRHDDGSRDHPHCPVCRAHPRHRRLQRGPRGAIVRAGTGAAPRGRGDGEGEFGPDVHRMVRLALAAEALQGCPVEREYMKYTALTITTITSPTTSPL